jgi:arylsulfatase A-like enzyme
MMRRLPSVLFLLTLLLSLGLFSCAGYPALYAGDPAPVALLGEAPAKARAQRVVVISIDGLRPDAIEAAGAETLKKLIERGAYCGKAETIRPSITLPSHTAMLTGLDYDHHGVSWNNYRQGYIPKPTIFSVAAQSKKVAAMLFSKDKFHFLANPACVSWIYGPPVPNKVPPKEDYSDPSMREFLIKRDEVWEKTPPPLRPTLPYPGELMTTAEMLAYAFNESWTFKKFDLTFVHFREPDENGHRKGWMGPEYIQGVKAVDRAIASIVATIEKNGGFEKVALIISADHGGSGRGHWRWLEPNRPENVTIPWICVGPGVPAGLKIDRVLRTFDTAPTALAFLGIGAPEGIDGKAVEEVLR